MAYHDEESWTEFLAGGHRRTGASSSFLQQSPEAHDSPHARTHQRPRNLGRANSAVLSGAEDFESEETPSQVEKAAAHATQGKPAVVSMKTGDVLTLKTLLDMAG